jgi:Na+-driven multidrug efflux pump
VGGIIAVLVNLALNGVLIFGLFGLEPMGVRGAAIATVVSRYVELAVVAGWTHLHKKACPFIVGAYRSLRIPKDLLLSILRKGLPLLANEFLWSSGVATLNQCYSTCGLDVVPALNIASTIQNLANVSSIALATAIGIIMGQMLGAGNSKEAVKDANRKLLVTALMCGVIFGFFLLGVSWMFPMLYNTTPAIRQLGGDLIRIIAVLMPVNAYVLACYFTLRAGGQALVTFLFDSCFMWVCSVALAFCLSRFADLPIIPLYAICQGTELIKCLIGTWLIKKDLWIKNLTQ